MSEQQGRSKDNLPTAINRVGDRLGLKYNTDRWKAAQEYVEKKIVPHCDITQDLLKKSKYALNEKKTIKKGDGSSRKHETKLPKNPLRLNAKKRKELYKLTKSSQLKYSTFEKINKIWEKYVLLVIREGGDALRLFRMDLHGCKLEVEASKNPTLIGHEGIVVQETKNTFVIIKPDNRTFIVPKKDSIFTFAVESVPYRVYGSSLLLSAQNRTKAKFKQKRAGDEI